MRARTVGLAEETGAQFTLADPGQVPEVPPQPAPVPDRALRAAAGADAAARDRRSPGTRPSESPGIQPPEIPVNDPGAPEISPPTGPANPIA